MSAADRPTIGIPRSASRGHHPPVASARSSPGMIHSGLMRRMTCADNVPSVDEADFEARQTYLLRRGHLRALDVPLAVVLVVVDVVVAGNMLKDRPDFALPFLASCLTAVALGLVVAVRRRWPR